MTEEILKLAIKCGWPVEAGEPECGSLNLEAFYRAAYNKGVMDSSKLCESQVDLEYATGKVDHNEIAWCMKLSIDLKKLEMK